MNVQQIIETAYFRANGMLEREGLVDVDDLEDDFTPGALGDTLLTFILIECVGEIEAEPNTPEHVAEAYERMTVALREVQAVVDALALQLTET